MSESFDHELISAYYDGQLSAADRVRVEQLLQENPACQAYLDDLHLLRADLRALPQRTMRGDLLEQVLRRAERALLEGNNDIVPSAATEAESQDFLPTTAVKNEDACQTEACTETGTEVGAPEPFPPMPHSSGTPSRQSTGEAKLSRWDAPLWLALAASICLYLSLAGSDAVRELGRPAQGTVAVIEDSPRESTAFPAETVKKSAAGTRKPQEFGSDSQNRKAVAAGLPSAGPPSAGHAQGVELQAKDGNRASDSDLKSVGHDRALPMENGEFHADSAAVRRGWINRPENGNNAARELAQQQFAGPDNAVAGSVEREVDAMRKPVAGSFPPQFGEAKGQGYRQEKLALEAPRGASLQDESKESPIRQTVDLLRSQIVLCEVEATPDVFFAQFEQVLKTESIALATEAGHDLLANAPLGASAPQQDPRDERWGHKRQRAASELASQDEVRVYMLQADSAHLARAIARLEQLPEVRLRLSPQGNHRFDTAETAQLAAAAPLSKGGQTDEQAAAKGLALDVPPRIELSPHALPGGLAGDPQAPPARAPASPVPSENAGGGSAFSRDTKDGNQFKAFGGHLGKADKESDFSRELVEAKSLRLVAPVDQAASLGSPSDLRRNVETVADPQPLLSAQGGAAGGAAAQTPRASSSPAEDNLSAESGATRLQTALPDSGGISQAIIVVRVRPRPLAANAIEPSPALPNKAAESP